MSKKYTKKQIVKHFDNKCFFCDLAEYKLLDCHRIIEGKNKGTYNHWNMMTLCCNCHRKIHSGLIKILGKYHCTGPSLYIVHYIDEDGSEKWKRPSKVI